MVTALGVDLRKNNGRINCEVPAAKSKHYLERMHLFQYLNLNSGMKVQEHQPAGRFIPLTQIRGSYFYNGNDSS